MHDPPRRIIRHRPQLTLVAVLLWLTTACTLEPSDTSAPTVVISSPADNTTLADTSVTITGTASDNFGIARLEYTLNGGAPITLGASTGFSFNLTALPEGTHTVTVSATDAAGNTGQDRVRFERSAIAPTPTSFTLSVGKTGTGGGEHPERRELRRYLHGDLPERLERHVERRRGPRLELRRVERRVQRHGDLRDDDERRWARHRTI
jgi:hypothetical protein